MVVDSSAEVVVVSDLQEDQQDQLNYSWRLLEHFAAAEESDKYLKASAA